MSRVALALGLLAAVYVLTLASGAPADLATGVALAGVLLWAARRSPFGTRGTPLPHLPRRVVAFMPFAGAVLRDVTVGTWLVILVTLRLRPLTQPGIVAVPIADRTPVGVAVSALATTLSPGTFLVDVDWGRGMMLFHVLDARDPDGVRRMQQDLYDRYQRHVFP